MFIPRELSNIDLVSDNKNSAPKIACNSLSLEVTIKFVQNFTSVPLSKWIVNGKWHFPINALSSVPEAVARVKDIG